MRHQFTSVPTPPPAYQRGGRVSPLFHLLACVAFLFAAFALAGCGAAKKAIEGPNRDARVTVNWAERSRGKVNAPSSALSVKVTLKNAGATGGDIVITANRRSASGAYSEEYTVDQQPSVGGKYLEVRFYAGADQSGEIVAAANAYVTIGEDRNIIEDITNVENEVKSATILVNQTVTVGESVEILTRVANRRNEVVAVSPGSVRYAVVSGQDKIAIEGGTFMKGVAPGSAALTATVDGITSDAAPVTVRAILPAMRALLIADIASPVFASEVIVIRDRLTANNVPVTILPSLVGVDASGYDAIIFHESGDLATTAPLVVDWLNAGKGIVVLGNAAARLAGGNLNDRIREVDTSSIQAWFGGAREMNNKSYYEDVYARPTSGGNQKFPLSVGVANGMRIYDATDTDYPRFCGVRRDQIAPTADAVLVDASRVEDYDIIYAFAYETTAPSGGNVWRVYYQWHAYGLNTAFNANVDDTFLAGLKWTARR
jgi:hypothetical protein